MTTHIAPGNQIFTANDDGSYSFFDASGKQVFFAESALALAGHFAMMLTFIEQVKEVDKDLARLDVLLDAVSAKGGFARVGGVEWQS